MKKEYSPSQIILGGCLLAFGASFLNTGFILNSGISVSHLTGDISRLAIDMSPAHGSNSKELLKISIATLGFILGATFSGYFLHHPGLDFKMPYGRTLVGIGLILAGAHFTYHGCLELAIFLGSCACGMQNALATQYRGVILRTTHLTGLFTDLGMHLGMKLRGYSVEWWKITVPFYIFIAFFSGALISSVFSLYYKSEWLLYISIAYMAGGVMWSVYNKSSR